MQIKFKFRHLMTALLCALLVWGSDHSQSVSDAASGPSYKKFREISRAGPAIPGLSSYRAWVPQGLAVVPSKHWAIISHYSSRSGSAISITDTSSKKRSKTFYLYESGGKKHTGHVGGLAVTKYDLWIASGKSVYRVALNTLSSSRDYGNIMMKKYTLSHKASYATYSDGVLWIGEYMDGEDLGKTALQSGAHSMHIPNTLQGPPKFYNGKKMCQKGPQGNLHGYKLTSTGNLPSKPSYSWTTPDRIQGAAMTKDRVIYSQSCGRNTLSKLLVYTRGAGGKQVSSLYMPPMSEGIALNGSQLYINFESGAKKYAGAKYKPIKNLYLMKTSKLKM